MAAKNEMTSVKVSPAESGTPESRRKALELSTKTAPAFTIAGANCFATGLSAAPSTTSCTMANVQCTMYNGKIVHFGRFFCFYLHICKNCCTFAAKMKKW